MRAEEKIINEYIGLVLEKKNAAVSVSEICAKAGISRKTFYHYFQDRYSLVEAIFIREIEKPIKLGINMFMTSDEITTTMYRNFLKRKDFFMVAMKEEGKNTLFEDIILRIQSLNMEIFDPVIENKTKLEYLSYELAASNAMLLKKWMRGGMKESPEFMAEICSTNIRDFYKLAEPFIRKQV